MIPLQDTMINYPKISKKKCGKIDISSSNRDKHSLKNSRKKKIYSSLKELINFYLSRMNMSVFLMG
jgi:hypothetical protein